MKKSAFAFGAISIAAFGLVACGDNSSSSTAYELNIDTATSSGPAYGVVVPDTMQTLDTLLHSYFCNSAIKCSHVYLVEMDNVMECDGEAWVYLSDYQPSVCGYEPGKPNSSASVENPGDALSSSSSIVEEPEACVEHVQANITIKNVEHIVMDCGSSNVGQTVYLEDTQTLYTCENGAWIGERVAVCEEPEPSQPVEDVPSVSYGTMTDERDGQTYKTIEIGKQTWMAENLNFYKSTDGSVVMDSSFCYEDLPANCEKYGRLYQEFDASEACPDGWKMPTQFDWRELTDKLSELYPSKNLNEIARATTGWDDSMKSNNASGFGALAAGKRNSKGEYSDEEYKAYFWGDKGMLYYAWTLSKTSEFDEGTRMYSYYAYSLRCIKK
ncbi:MULTISPECIES: FISUMP domain-containing protein [unclassified Fibrobacter]|uniref:FISUMP domain-containing protein n=1 Tax=unclassified Fibrobacter TaxID=2634177 RepID=UPI000D6B3E2B|nr:MULTISPECIES: FISUMP domain-containing protein [unclassified Fibrobacter]PWJ69068.1 uncharacterized protein (TIGR02145 family) [Fibrobacter sp. UWR4]PZW72899.1 uncharacterized protein (TIGR02145 family) [Fibrobacter sp. UWR1]